MKSSLHRPGGVILAGALVTSVFAFMPAAHAVELGTITGTVTGSGQNLDEINVAAYTFDGDRWDVVEDGYTYTDKGSYTLNLPPGDYRLGFDDYTGGHLDEYYLDSATVEDAETFRLGDGGLQVIDADLDVASHITGTVTGPDELPLEFVNVAALTEVPNGPDDSYWVAVEFGETDASGNYDIGGLRPGNYRVEFGDRLNDNDYASEFYDDQATELTAVDVEVGVADLDEDIDAELAFESTISGTVIDAADEGLGGVGVFFYERAGGQWGLVDELTTDEDGGYTVGHLPRGNYRVEFAYETPEGDYLWEYYNNVGELDQSELIDVEEDTDVINIDAKLVAGEHDPVPFTMNALPVISGTPQVGSTLTVTGGSWSPTPATTEYHWFRGEDYTGVSATSYVPTAADVGRTLSVLVQVYGSEGQYEYANTGEFGPIVAAPVDAVPPPATADPVLVPVPVTGPVPVPVTGPVQEPVLAFSKKIDVVGKLVVGSTLKLKKYKALVSVGSSAVTYKIQWYAGSKKIKKATKPKLKLTKQLKGKKLKVKVTATAGATTKSVKVNVGKIR